MLAACCLLHDVWCMLRVGLLFVVFGALCVARCVLGVGCCLVVIVWLLIVVCWLMFRCFVIVCCALLVVGVYRVLSAAC